MNLAQITDFINLKIRNKTPKVIKTELADVQQEIVNELYSNITINDNNSEKNVLNNLDLVEKNFVYDLVWKKIGKTASFFGKLQRQGAINPFNYQNVTLRIDNNNFFLKQHLDSANNEQILNLLNSYVYGKKSFCSITKNDNFTYLQFFFENGLDYFDTIYISGQYTTEN